MSSVQIFELPVSLDDLPNFKIKDQNFISETLLQSTGQIEIATKFVKELQTYLDKDN